MLNKQKQAAPTETPVNKLAEFQKTASNTSLTGYVAGGYIPFNRLMGFKKGTANN